MPKKTEKLDKELKGAVVEYFSVQTELNGHVRDLLKIHQKFNQVQIFFNGVFIAGLIVLFYLQIHG